MAPKSKLPYISPKPFLERYKEENKLCDGSNTEAWQRAWKKAEATQKEFNRIRKEQDSRDPELRTLGARKDICKQTLLAHRGRRRGLNNKRSAHGTRVRDIVFLRLLGHEVDEAHNRREATMQRIADLRSRVAKLARENAELGAVVQRRDVLIRAIEAKRHEDQLHARPVPLELDYDDSDCEGAMEAAGVVKEEKCEDVKYEYVEYIKVEKDEDVKEDEDESVKDEIVKQEVVKVEKDVAVKVVVEQKNEDVAVKVEEWTYVKQETLSDVGDDASTQGDADGIMPESQDSLPELKSCSQEDDGWVDDL